LPFLSKRWRLYHWRLDAWEIDIAVEASGNLLALFEMKVASAVGAEGFRHVDWFGNEGPGGNYRTAGFVVCLGSQLLSFGPGLIALALSMLWSFNG